MPRNMTKVVDDEQQALDETKKTTKATKKKYDPEDLIMCRSITSGGLHIKGDRSNFLYSWADYGDEVGIEYRDLIFMMRSNDKNIFKPRIIIEDADIVEENKKVKELYESLYTVGDFKEIVKMSPAEMCKQIEKLPDGTKEAFKDYVADMINSHTLDSVKRIKALDDLFGTNYLLMLAED